MRRLLSLALAPACLASAGALADEVWSSSAGEITYVNDEGGFAILFQQGGEDGMRNLYVSGLAGNYEDRTGIFTGYWIGLDEGTSPDMKGASATDYMTGCEAELVAVDGTRGRFWGRVELQFVSPGFPSAFIARTGSCFDDPTETFTAAPITG